MYKLSLKYNFDEKFIEGKLDKLGEESLVNNSCEFVLML
jgi:hypothetical protein